MTILETVKNMCKLQRHGSSTVIWYKSLFIIILDLNRNITEANINTAATKNSHKFNY